MEIQPDRMCLNPEEIRDFLKRYASLALGVPETELETVYYIDRSELTSGKQPSRMEWSVAISRKHPYRIIRAGEGYGTALLVTPSDAKPGEASARYFEFHPGRRRMSGWNDDGFNEVDWESDARYLFSGMADGMGFAPLPPYTFESLNTALAYVLREKEAAYRRWAKVTLEDMTAEGDGDSELAQEIRQRLAAHPES